jgi:hypothetical protein
LRDPRIGKDLRRCVFDADLALHQYQPRQKSEVLALAFHSISTIVMPLNRDVDLASVIQECSLEHALSHSRAAAGSDFAK